MRLRQVALALLLACCAVGLYVFGRVTGGFLAWFLFYVFITGIAYEWATAVLTFWGVSVEIEAPRQALAGDHVTFSIVVRFANIWPVFWLRAYEVVPVKWRLSLIHI